MDVQKWVGLSRRVWAVLIPVATLVSQSFGFDLTVYITALEGFGAPLAALVSAGLMAWSLIRPDNAKLTAVPKKT